MYRAAGALRISTEYRNELVQRLAAEKVQQGRSKVILEALKIRLEAAKAR